MSVPATGSTELVAAGTGGDAAVYEVRGPLDFETVPSLSERGREMFAAGRHVVVDLSGVTHANSAGLALLLEWQRAARRTGARLSVRRLPAVLANLAAMSELGPYLPPDDAG